MSEVKESKRKKKDLSIRFGEVTKDNVGQLRELNLAIFPVVYNEKFYKDVVKEQTKELIQLAYHSDVLVGAVCCRIEKLSDSENKDDDDSPPDTDIPQSQDKNPNIKKRKRTTKIQAICSSIGWTRKAVIYNDFGSISSISQLWCRRQNVSQHYQISCTTTRSA